MTQSLSVAVVAEIAERLGRYVYVLVDPRDPRPFYVGKGRGARMLSHGIEAQSLSDDHNSAKLDRIREIRAGGREPEIWIARYGLTESGYTEVEAALIDALGSFPIVPATPSAPYRPLERRDELTNRRREESRAGGMVLLSRLIDDLAAPLLSSEQPLLLITVKPWLDLEETVAGGRTRPGYGFKREWFDQTIRRRDIGLLEAATNSWWIASPVEVARQGVLHSVAVFQGVTRGLFEIGPWEQDARGNRWGFSGTPILEGELYDQVIGEHGHRVPSQGRGAQNPVSYWPRRRDR